MSDKEKTDLNEAQDELYPDSDSDENSDIESLDGKEETEPGASGNDVDSIEENDETDGDEDEDNNEDEDEDNNEDDEDEGEIKKSPLINVMVVVVILLAIGYLPLHFYLEARKTAEISRQFKQKAYEFSEKTKEPGFSKFIIDEKHDEWFSKAGKAQKRSKRDFRRVNDILWQNYRKMMKFRIDIEINLPNSELRTKYKQHKDK